MFIHQAMSRLTALMELNLQVLGIPDKCDAVWDQILNVRMQLNEIKVQKEVNQVSFLTIMYDISFCYIFSVFNLFTTV